MRATNGVTASVATMRSGCVIFAAMYAAVHVPTLPAADVVCHPARIAAQKLTITIAKIT